MPWVIWIPWIGLFLENSAIQSSARLYQFPDRTIKHESLILRKHDNNHTWILDDCSSHQIRLLGSEFRQALHIRFFTLFDTFNDQIPFHNPLSWLISSTRIKIAASSLKKWYLTYKRSSHLVSKAKKVNHLTPSLPMDFFLSVLPPVERKCHQLFRSSIAWQIHWSVHQLLLLPLIQSLEMTPTADTS